MNRIERLTGLLLVLQQGQRSAQELADRFEVSRRTILRDLDALGEMGVPIVSTPGRSGGFRVMDDFWLPPLHLSAGEATAVLLALELAGNADGESPWVQLIARSGRRSRERCIQMYVMQPGAPSIPLRWLVTRHQPIPP